MVPRPPVMIKEIPKYRFIVANVARISGIPKFAIKNELMRPPRKPTARAMSKHTKRINQIVALDVDSVTKVFRTIALMTATRLAKLIIERSIPPAIMVIAIAIAKNPRSAIWTSIDDKFVDDRKVVGRLIAIIVKKIAMAMSNCMLR